MIAAYRKKPIQIEAIQWDGTNFDELKNWGAPVHFREHWENVLVVGTLEDGPQCQVQHIATEGDFIVRGIQGEFYPCKPDIFYATYEAL